jgi:glycosyltransferase involved in cell wall biosynthesis
MEREIYECISEDETNSLKAELNINDNDVVAIFCSRMYKDKNIEFLLESLDRIKNRFPNFKIIVIGDGPEAFKIKQYALKNTSWFIYVGSKYGRDKIKYFKLASFQLLPGLVGLHVVDSFAFETPIVTTDNKLHSVEIDYIKNYENGIISKNGIDDYVDKISELCTNKNILNQLIEGCRKSAEIYTVEQMAVKFAEGVVNVINQNGAKS